MSSTTNIPNVCLRLRAAVILALPVVLSIYAKAQLPTPEALARFPVAHQHNGGWCLGYLYIYSDSIAYDVTWPQAEKAHSFTLHRSELRQVGRWLRAGQPLKAVEVNSAKSTYHFWWLANEQDVINGREYRNDPADAGEPDQLITAIREPSTLLADANGMQTPAVAASTMPADLQQVPDSPIASIVAGSPAGAAANTPAETRFAVAHAHALLFCVGYLYVSAGNVRYEVVQPVEDKKHAFQLSRTEITGVQQWLLAGKPRNAAEIKTAHGNYHFWLLPDSSDVANTPYRQWNANNIVPIGPLLSALQVVK